MKNSAASAKGSRAEELSGSSPARMVSAKGRPGSLRQFSVKDVLFLDTGCAFPRYRMCYFKILDVLFQDTGCAIPIYWIYYSKIQDVLFQDSGCAIARYRMCYSKRLM